MRDRSDILLVGQTPPPFHGQAVVTGMLFDHEWGGLNVKRLRMAFSDDMESVGEASWVKVWRLIVLIFKTWSVVISSRPRILYYLPASPNLAPVLRDFVYLASVRWLFPKTVFHYHAGGLDQFVGYRAWLRNCVKWVYDGADRSIDVNVTEPPSGAYFRAEKNLVVMNGLDVGKANRNRPEALPFQILYVGLLCEPKGLLGLVETAAILKTMDHDCQFILVGDWESEEFENDFKKAIKDADVRGMFCFKGVLKGTRKWQAYADADLFIFPSHHPTETFGLVLLEAMAFSLPIVTNRWRGIPHVIGDSICAKMCEVKNAEQYAKAIADIFEDSAERKSMGVAAREHYEKHYTRDRFVSGMKAVFKGLLEEEGAK